VRGHRGRYPLLTDEGLISLVGEGDAFAFNVLYDRHSRATYSLARREWLATRATPRTSYRISS
jgi:hypothetical protein